MNAREFLKNKGINPIEPIYWDLEHKQIQLDELMEDFAEQQLKILNLPDVMRSLPDDKEIGRVACEEVQNEDCDSIAVKNTYIDAFEKGALWMRSELK